MPSVISLGAGVQSTALLLMADAGEFGARPDLAIFADTGWEPKATYEHLDWLESQVSIPIVRVSKGNLRDDTMKSLDGERGDAFASIPVYVKSPTTGKREGALRRQCTREYKLDPIYRELRSRGYRNVEMWLGISLDEVQRMKPARVKWATNRWPLIEKRMSRRACVEWMRERGYPEPPKSACIGCPYHGDNQWRDLRDNRPEEWEEAVEFDAAIRQLPRIEGDAFLHRSLVPLPMVDLSTPEDRGQQSFDEECEGMCGV